jgi:hypothetical protein
VLANEVVTMTAAVRMTGRSRRKFLKVGKSSVDVTVHPVVGEFGRVRAVYWLPDIGHLQVEYCYSIGR